jgi:hypothetical protein
MVASALVAISCSKDIQNSESVKQGVMDYLKSNQAKTGLNVEAMQVEVRTVSFQRDEARAGVAITPKGMPGAGMQINYVLARNGNKWVVRGRTENGANPHGASELPRPSELPHAGELPQGLPPNHPQVETQSQPGGPGQLPAGHPPVSTKK